MAWPPLLDDVCVDGEKRISFERTFVLTNVRSLPDDGVMDRKRAIRIAGL